MTKTHPESEVRGAHPVSDQVLAGIALSFKAARKKVGLSQAEVARRAQCRPSVVRQIENKNGAPPLGTLEAIAKAVGGRLSVSVLERTNASKENRAGDAYHLRAQGLRWPEIAKLLGYATEHSAHVCARMHAQSVGLPWPIRLKRRADAYGLYQGGLSWSDVAPLAGYDSPGGARAAARRHARAHSLAWPPAVASPVG